jgi:hypothetical protein
MPPAAIGLAAGLGGALAGGIGGATNTRPPSLDPVQRKILDALLPQLFAKVQGPPTIDPIQQAGMFGQIAQSRTGADTGVTHALASRGLGRSGILGSALMQNQDVASTAQNTANLGLQQQAVELQQQNIGDIMGLLGVSNIPGQSGVGGFFSGIAPLLAFLGATH